MKTIQLTLSGLLLALMCHSTTSRAEDIDIYSGLGSTVNVPNVMIVIDNAANFGSNAAGFTDCPITDPVTGVVTNTTLTMHGTVGGIEQCALYNVIQTLPTNADGSARINLGIMVYNANNIRDINGQVCGDGSTGGCLVKPLTPIIAANKAAFLNWILTWDPSGGTIKASGEATGAAMQEAWAYYRGDIGISGRNYSGIKPASGCQKNFVIFIGNSYSASGTPGDAPSSASTKLGIAPGVTAAQQVQILDTVTTSCTSGAGGSTSFTFPSSAHETKGYYADEWARYMYQADLYTAAGPPADPTGVQSITTYSIGILGAACQNEYAGTLISMAHYGGGKYFPTTDYSGLVVSILKILNEVQAVNSVFSSSSLPVSVNAQGTYLNQIYMGMFRPDPGALPRWAGNLKQYQFIVNPTSGDLQLGDSIGQTAIDGSGTGFMSPNAISYWTCSRSDNPYLSGTNTLGLPNVTAAQRTLLTNQGQICATDPANGFWVNFPGMTNSAGKAFDMSDGELVEKGGIGQSIRLNNLTANYTTAAGTAVTNPRKLYTHCPSGAGCVANLTDTTNTFDTANPDLTAAMFGSSVTVNISSIVRSGTTATVTTSGNHGFLSGDSITIANTSPSDYSGVKTILSVPTSTTFTYSIIEYPPLAVTVPSNYTASPTSGGTLRNVSNLVRSGNTATATSVGHGFLNGTSVVIAGATLTSSDFNNNGGSVSIFNKTADTFDYTVNEKPPTVAGSGTATITWKTTGTGCPCTIAATINAWNAATPGVQRTLGSTTVTVNTNTNMVNSPTWVGKAFTITGVKDSHEASVAAYNITSTIASVSGNSFTFILAAAPTPTSPATGTITATGVIPQTLTSLTRTGSTATAVVPAHGFLTGASISIGGTPGANEGAYIGTVTITKVDNDTFTYPVATSPATPPTGMGGAAMTATRSSGFIASDLTNLIKWVRGQDNYGDETGPGGGVTIRPSVHGDVLHSRPTVLNYGGALINITATSDSAGIRTATATTTTVIGTVGATANVKFSTGAICAVTVASATTFTYSTTNCGNTGAQEAMTDSANIVVYYGDNGGVFHAVNGNQVNPAGSLYGNPGSELWGFIPKEHFIKLSRLRTNSPQLNLPSTPPGILPVPTPKNYFVDGPTGVYQVLDSKGKTLLAYLYLSMRRGGRMIYALNVTDPLTPTLLWKKDETSAGMSELGQTWSTPKVAKVAGYPNPVLIFAAGYDSNQDNDPPTVLDSMGRGIFVLDAASGALVWKATYDATAAGTNLTTYTTTVNTAGSDRMKYSIPSDVTLMDTNHDGYIDRLYVADTGGQVWRVDLEPGGSSAPASWKLHRLASLGECGTAVCRKFFYPPEVIHTSGYDAVIVGSGDREHPLYNNTAATGKQNMVFLLKDDKTGNDFTGKTRISLALDHLVNATCTDSTRATCTTVCGTANHTGMLCTAWDGTASGYYFNLLDGEKVVNAPLVTAGYVYFGTNQPTSPSTTSCTATLGTARGYQLSPFTSTYKSMVFSGGGLPPSPVSGVVNITVNGVTKLVPFLIGGGNPDCTGSDCASALGGQKPTISVPTSRTRTYWYQEVD